MYCVEVEKIYHGFSRRGACGHIMAAFDQHSGCVHCREKGQGNDPCIKNLDFNFCNVLTNDHKAQLSTPPTNLEQKGSRMKYWIVPAPENKKSTCCKDQKKSTSSKQSTNFKENLEALDNNWLERTVLPGGTHCQVS